MSVSLIASLACLGTIGGFAAGLLGFGGGVLMFPLLYYVPPLLDLPRFDAKTVAAVVITQVFFSTLIGGVAHLRSGRVHTRIAVTAGLASAGGSFVGAVGSKWATESFLLLLFAVTCLLVLAMMFLRAPSHEVENVSIENVAVAPLRLGFYSLLTGVVIGFLGAGNFVFVPLLIYVLKVPTRIAIGSTLLIALMNTASGFLGKLVTAQIPVAAAAAVVAGAGLGAVAGEKIHGKVSPQNLRLIYAAMVSLIALRVWFTILE